MADELPEHPPRVAIPMDDKRIWIDGCFDFTHHGTYIIRSFVATPILPR